MPKTTRPHQHHRCCLAALLGLMAPAYASGTPTMAELFHAKYLKIPTQNEKLSPSVMRGNFTFFSPSLLDVKVEGSSLRFRMGAENGTIGWGNFGGRQRVSERVFLRKYQHVAFTLRQSEPVKTKLRLWAWGDGQRSKSPTEATYESTEAQEIKLKFPRIARRSTAIPDGFDIEIETTKGNVLGLTSVEVVRPVNRGGFRKELDLPASKIWRAVVNVGAQTIIYVNGEEVLPQTAILKRPTFAGNEMYKTRALDLAEHLEAGKPNCIALHGERVGYPPFMFIQGSVVMTSGEVVGITSDGTWRFSHDCPEGWTQAGFDDGSWALARAAGVSPSYMIMASTTETAVPAYSGRLVVTNPKDRLLFYNDKEPAVFNVSVPVGLGKDEPVLRWQVAGGMETAEGSVRGATRTDDSLTYTVDAAVLDWGVYTIELTLRGRAGEILEHRHPEPFVVVRRLTQKQVAGSTYTQGMDLTLEDTIDFTDPADRHPSNGSDTPGGFERGLKTTADPIREPGIVRRGGLLYRETAPVRGAFFTYQFKVKGPGDFYLMELDYPDDAERWIGVSCSTIVPKVWTNSKCGPSLTTGGKYPLTGRMQVHRWISRPEAGTQTIDVICRRNGCAAAAKGLRIFHVKELPALRIDDSRQRRIGILTERTHLTRSFGKTFGMHRRDIDWRNAKDFDAPNFRPFDEKVEYLQAALDACEKYTQYLRFTGQNVHIMGCYQYGDKNTPYAPLPRIAGCSRVPNDIRDVAVRAFGENGIDVIASIEYANHEWLALKYDLTLGEVLQGKDTARMVSSDGKPTSGMYGWNFVHPDVEAAMLSVVDDLVHKFRDRPNFLGVNFSPYLSGGWIPGYGIMSREGPMTYSYDDRTIMFFERDTGIRLPIKAVDPARFAKRHRLLTSKALWDKWVAWRCEQMRRFFRLVQKRAVAQREDLQMFASLYMNVSHCVEWSKSDLPLSQFLREWGWDPDLMRTDDGIWFTRWLFPLRANSPKNYAGWEQVVGSEFAGLYAREDHRSVMIHHAWDELAYRMPGAKFGRDWEWVGEPNWPVAGNRSRLHTQASGENARETFTHTLIGSDPELVMFGFMDVNLMVGNEQPLREFAQVLRCLPKERFAPALDTGLTTNLAIRELRKGSAYYFYVANPGYWPIKGTIELTGAGRVIDLALGRPAETSGTGQQLTLPVALAPYGVAAYRADSKDARITSWATERIPEERLAHLKGIIARVGSLLAQRGSTAILTIDEKKFMQEAVRKANGALQRNEVAAAWSMVTNYRFWGLWKDYLEKITELAQLPYPKRKLADTLGHRTLALPFAAKSPAIDGDLTDDVWAGAEVETTFVTLERRPALVDTAVRACYDRSHVYFAIECADAEPHGLRTEATKEKEVFSSRDDAVGIFLQPDPSGTCYYQLAFNAAGVRFDQKVLGGQRDYEYRPDWQAATKRHATKWTAEVAVPFAAFGLNEMGQRQWRANFFRSFRKHKLDAGMWSFTGRDGHCPERFGTLVFVE